MNGFIGSALGWVYFTGSPITFIYLTFFDGYDYTSWNWIIAIPINMIVASIWPVYWGIVHWIPGIG